MHTQTKNLLGTSLNIGTVLLCFAFFLLSSTSTKAQINNNRFRVNLNSFDMGPCDGTNDAHSIVGVLARSVNVNNFEIAFDLPDGVNFIPGTETITFQQGSSDFILTLVDMSDLNAPVFGLERPGNVDWQVADLVRFRFDKTASCDAVVFSYGGGLFKDTHTITYDDINGSQSVSDTDLKFKPSIFAKQVTAAPLAVDVSANFLVYETLNLGVNYRWDDSVSAPFGVQVSPKFNFGYAYDFSINELNNYNSGNHEIFLRYQLITGENRLKSPRFF